MKIAYVDSSCFVSVAAGQPGYREVLSQLARFDRLVSSNLLEAELRAALAREGGGGPIKNFISWMDWVFPSRRLTPEINEILEIGSVRGADLWHLACALFLKPRLSGSLSFLTLDGRQGSIARSLGFPGL